jgi:hypothetical protein
METLTPHSTDELSWLVIDWAKARKIIPNAKPHTQLLKAVSELGELADAEIKGDREGIIDGAGDVMVCIINYLALHGLTIRECLEAAYEQIKNRKGTLLENGVFVKDE